MSINREPYSTTIGIVLASVALLVLAGCASSASAHEDKPAGVEISTIAGVNSSNDIALALGCTHVMSSAPQYGAKKDLSCEFEGDRVHIYEFDSLGAFESFVAGDNPIGKPSKKFAHVGTRWVVWPDHEASLEKLIDLLE